MTKEHPFAQYVRIIGKGPHMSRNLTLDEARDATAMILKDEVLPIQLGAFLCVLRVRTEVPEEGAGFVQACRDSFEIPADAPKVDVDWASYSGKARQLPWFVLSALTLADAGIKVFMHGTEGHTDGRIYTREVLQFLGLPISGSLAEAANQMKASNFAFLPLAKLAPKLQEIIELKPILGLRSPVNTFARMLNPFGATLEMQAVFHPGYRDIHRDTAALLGQKNMAIFKGEGGEIERRPNKPVLVQYLFDGRKAEEEWAPMLPEDQAVEHDLDMNLARIKALWNGEGTDDYGTAAVLGTIAIALRGLERASSMQQADDMARDLWDARNRSRIQAA